MKPDEVTIHLTIAFVISAGILAHRDFVLLWALLPIFTVLCVNLYQIITDRRKK